MAGNIPGLPLSTSVGVYNGPNMTGATAGLQTPNPALIGQTTQAILGLQGTAQENTMNAQAEQVAATGDTAEATAYQTAAQIAGGQAGVAQISGQIQQYQQQLQVQQTIGSQKASIGAAGFTESGSALDLMRSSLQQGALGSQMIGLQASLTEMGYTAAEAAAMAESTAAMSAASQASTLSGDYTTAANTATANETAATKDLTNYLTSLNPTGSSLTGADKTLLTDITAGNTGAVQLDINSLVTGPVGAPSALSRTGPTGQINGQFGPFGTDITPANAGLGGWNPFAPTGQTLAVVGPTGAALNNPSGA